MKGSQIANSKIDASEYLTESPQIKISKYTCFVHQLYKFLQYIIWHQRIRTLAFAQITNHMEAEAYINAHQRINDDLSMLLFGIWVVYIAYRSRIN
jgi:hypothetical protein